jgi:hypothetical protein
MRSSTPSVALVTCASLPDLDADDQLLREPLERLGIDAVPAVWDDASVDWTAFDLVVVRSPWDYTRQREKFLVWARSVPRLVNPADVIDWNTHKTYLSELASRGIPVVPTTWLDPSDVVVLPVRGRHVVKPAVGAGSVDAAAYTLHVEHEARLASEHAARLLASGQTVMIQPYLDAIEQHGETGLIFLGGEYSHAVKKAAMLADERGLAPGGLFKVETLTAHQATDAELAVARRALAAVPGGARRLAYARVDVVPDTTGPPLLIELELTEPSLFLVTAPSSAERFARVLADLVENPAGK